MTASIQYYDVILKLLVIEKSMAGVAEERCCFLARPEASKTMIKEVMEKVLAGTKVKSVSAMSHPAKAKRRGTTVGQTARGRKVVAQLTADSKEIEIFQGL